MKENNQQRKKQKEKGASSASSQPPSKRHQHSRSTGTQQASASNRANQKSRGNVRQEDRLNQQMVQTVSQTQDAVQLQDHNLQLHALCQNDNQQPQNITMLQGAPQLQQQQQSGHQVQEVVVTQVSDATQLQDQQILHNPPVLLGPQQQRRHHKKQEDASQPSVTTQDHNPCQQIFQDTPTLQEGQQKQQPRQMKRHMQQEVATQPSVTNHLQNHSQEILPTISILQNHQQMQHQQRTGQHSQQEVATQPSVTKLRNQNHQVSQNIRTLQGGLQLQHPQRCHMQHQVATQPSVKTQLPHEGSHYYHRLLQHLQDLHNRPSDNNILYWRKVVSHYFASSVKKRWCLSRYETQPCAPAPSSHPSMDAWQCEICRCKPATGYEAAFEVLPRIIKANFDSGVKSENLHFDNPLVYVHPSREKVFLFCKAVQETVYDRFRVYHEGRLHVVFSGDLKIMSWGFCVRRHEVFFSYGLIESQVNLLIQSTQNYQSAMMERGADGISPQVLSEYSNMLLTAGKCFQKGLNLNNYVDEFGFNTKIVRFLQMAEVLSSMEGLMVVSKFNDMGPIGCYEKLSPRMGNLRSSAASDPGLSSNREDSVEIGEEKIILTDLHEKLLDYSVESESPIMQESTLVANVNPGQSQSASGSGLSITSSNVTQTYGGR